MNFKIIPAIAAFLCALSFDSPAQTPKEASVSKDVSAAQVNGTWKCGNNTFKILAWRKGSLRVAFYGLAEYKSSYGLTANIGEGQGFADIVGDTAVFLPTGKEIDGKITLKFAGGKLIAEQEGTCGFGHRVWATGTYKKTSSRKPNFDK